MDGALGDSWLNLNLIGGACSTIRITYSKARHGGEAFSIHPSMDGIIQGRKPWQK
jgi:hypothetical protein